MYTLIQSHCISHILGYVSQHPGGDSILNNAGGDSTEGVHAEHHPPTVWDVLAEYYIGDLKPGEVGRKVPMKTSATAAGKK